jgi:hypothetical protein
MTMSKVPTSQTRASRRVASPKSETKAPESGPRIKAALSPLAAALGGTERYAHAFNETHTFNAADLLLYAVAAGDLSDAILAVASELTLIGDALAPECALHGEIVANVFDSLEARLRVLAELMIREDRANRARIRELEAELAAQKDGAA